MHSESHLPIWLPDIVCQQYLSAKKTGKNLEFYESLIKEEMKQSWAEIDRQLEKIWNKYYSEIKENNSPSLIKTFKHHKIKDLLLKLERYVEWTEKDKEELMYLFDSYKEITMLHKKIRRDTEKLSSHLEVLFKKYEKIGFNYSISLEQEEIEEAYCKAINDNWFDKKLDVALTNAEDQVWEKIKHLNLGTDESLSIPSNISKIYKKTFIDLAELFTYSFLEKVNTVLPAHKLVGRFQESADHELIAIKNRDKSPINRGTTEDRFRIYIIESLLHHFITTFKTPLYSTLAKFVEAILQKEEGKEQIVEIARSSKDIKKRMQKEKL